MTLLLLALVLRAESGRVMLSWDAPEDAALVAGYRVYWGSATGTYSQSLDVGNVTSAHVPLAPGVYFFAVTAYTAEGAESEFSNEITGTFLSFPFPPALGWPP